ncbi:MAG: diguanylate cyclase, partial [Actinomycetes bacterium]
DSFELGQVFGITPFSGRDIQTEVEARLDLARSEQRFRLAMEFAPTGMALVDLDRRFIEVNQALCRMLGRDEEWLLSHRVPEILDADENGRDLQMRAEVLGGSSTSIFDTQKLITADGGLLVVEHSIGVLRDERGIPLSYVSQFVDITEAYLARERLEFMARHDSLTALANRHELNDGLGRILSHSPRTGTGVGVLFIDVDNLKTVNDEYGHAVGDGLLVEVARRIRSRVRSNDLVARIGGDEFVVVLTQCGTEEDAVSVANKILDAVRDPVHVDVHQLSSTVSIGATLAARGDDADRVLARADSALYQAKRQGRDRVALADPH